MKTDEELAREARAGSRPAFEELALRYKRRLFVYLRPRLASDQDTEDMVQETFLKLYRNIDRYDPDLPFLDLALHRGDPPDHQLLPEEEDRGRAAPGRGGRRRRRSGGRAAGGDGYGRAVGLRQDSRGEPVPGPVAPLRGGHGGRGDRPGRRQKPGRREPAPPPGPDEPDEEDGRRARRGDGGRQARGGGRTDGRMKEGRTIMLCHLARRAISGSEDRGKALPRWAGRHIGRCEACREYARFAASLKTRLAGDRAAFLAAVPEFPLKEAAWDKAGTGRKERVSSRPAARSSSLPGGRGPSRRRGGGVPRLPGRSPRACAHRR